MMRRVAIGLVLLLLVAMAGLLLIGPGLVEKSLNKIVAQDLPAPSPAVQALHRRLAIADLHADTLLWQRSLLDPATRGHVDLPRLEAGNVALQIFSSVTKSPKGLNYDRNAADSDDITALALVQLQPPRTWSSLAERSLWHSAKLHRAEAASEGRLRIVRSAADVRRLLADRAGGKPVTGAMLSVEGLHNLEGKIANLARLDAAGFRMAGLVHFFDNEVGGSMHGLAKGGLTPFGRQVVRAMEARGMIVDLAHASPATVRDVLAMARRPVVSSHGGVQATCKVNRNLTDDQVRGIAATGGLVGIGYWDGAVCSADPAAIAAAIAHVRGLVGIGHVALGSDFDGSVTTGFDTSELVQVTRALAARGFTEAEIAAVMGGNLLRLLGTALPQR
jgi:microsomal dipeptidase-like Zn-dependent dipeptidase